MGRSRSHSGWRLCFLCSFSFNIFTSTALSIWGYRTARRFITMFELTTHLLDEEVLQIFFPWILFLDIIMLMFHFIQLFQLLLRFCIKLFLNLKRIPLFWCSWRSITLIFPSRSCFTFSSSFPRLIKPLKKSKKVIKRSKLVETKELFLFDLFVAQSILADCRFEHIESIEKIDLRTTIIDIEFKMFLETTFNVVELIYLLSYLFLFLLENSLKVLSVLLFFFLDQFLQLSELLCNHLLMNIVSLLYSAFVSLAGH